MPAEDNRALIRRYYLDEVRNKGNLALVAKLVAPDCLVHDPAMVGISCLGGMLLTAGSTLSVSSYDRR